ncbi:MAG: hypothetical protein L0G99_01555, partial [Propionibacteriales bacterium]|nr:hypothetical protein [Propionibacteriales bacterium]
MTTPTIHGYPRQGPHRELKRAIEGHWQGKINSTDLLARIGEIRRDRLRTVATAGLTEVPIGDFSLYDHVLDTTLLL